MKGEDKLLKELSNINIKQIFKATWQGDEKDINDCLLSNKKITFERI